MNYEEAGKYLKNIQSFGISLGLKRMKELCRRLRNPEKELSFIHVAGTNGKGSTAAYISSILAVGGYLTGRYVSPAVFRYEECIQYEDMRGVHYIDRELLAELVTEVSAAAEEMVRDGWEHPTVFEIETAVSFLAFVRWQCRIVLLEVGLGGREDATNVVEHVIASVITPISLDHTAVLGETLEKIAEEKAGIIKPEGLVITLQNDCRATAVIQKRADEENALMIVVRNEDITYISANLEGSVFSYKGENYRTSMPGRYQVSNACLAIETCRRLPKPFALDEEQIMLGIRMAQWRGRFEVVCPEPLVIIDGAHNPAGAEALLASVKELLSGRTLHGIMGVFKDKDYETMVKIVAPIFRDVVTVTAPGNRGLDAGLLAEEWKKNLCPEVATAKTVNEALKKVLAHYREGEAVLIFGSLSLFKELNWKV